MKYQVTIKTSAEQFDTTVVSDRVGMAKTLAIAEFLKTRKLSGDLVLYRVKDEAGNLLVNQF